MGSYPLKVLFRDPSSVLAASTPSALIFPATVVALCLLFRHFKLNDALAMQSNDEQYKIACSTTQSVLLPVAGFVAVLAAILWLERRQPYYFTQDDSLALFLPTILQGCRSFFGGVFPTWNPYQFMGAPTTSLGYFGLTYPLTYLSYWLSKTALHNENATLDVFVIIHLLLGYCAIYWAVRREGCRPSIAMLAASSCSVSGFALIFCRSWYNFSPILLWMPLMVICVQELVRGNPGWKWIVTFGAVIGVSFHVGHTQMWVYSVMLTDVAIALLAMTGYVSAQRLTACLAAHFIGLAIAAPLLVPVILATYNVARYPDATGISSGLKGLFIPDSLSASPHLLNWAPGYPLGEMYYSGTLFMVISAVLLLSLLTTRWDKVTARRNIWFLCALVAFQLALGGHGLLWTGMTHLPGFNRFRFPFKFQAYLVFFSSMGGAVALERFMRKRKWSGTVEAPLVLVAWAVLAYHCTLCTAAFYNYGFQPFPQPDQEIARRLVPSSNRYYPKVWPVESKDGQGIEAFPYSGFRSHDPHFVDSFMNQCATVQGAFSVDGYDNLVNRSPAVLRMTDNIGAKEELALSEYGVKYILQYDPPDSEHSHPRVRRTSARGKLVYQSGTVFLTELPDPRPMAFAEERPQTPLPVNFDASGAAITTSEVPQGGRVVLNMLWRREIQSHVSGSIVAATADDWGRIVLQIPPGTREVRVTFRQPWEYGFALAGVALLLGSAIGWWSGRCAQFVSPNEMVRRPDQPRGSMIEAAVQIGGSSDEHRF